MNESQAFREAAGLHSAAAPYWAILLYTGQGWTVSHEGNHTENGTWWQLCENPLRPPAVVVLLTNECRQIDLISGELEQNLCADASACVAGSTRPFDPSRSLPVERGS